jgi:radical SAM protein with 4Fe4S-binding SPASM domain
MVVSLDGASAPTHEVLRGEGQFAVTLSFLRELQGLGIQTYLNCVLHDGNLHEIDAYIDLAKDFKIQQINFLPLVPKGYGKALRCHQAPHLGIHRLLQAAYHRGDESTRNLLAGSLPDILRLERDGITCAACECVAAYRGLFYIKPDGSIYTCPNLEAARFSVGNVARDSLRTAASRLNHLYAELRSSEANDRYICTGEREKYQTDGDLENLNSLSELQSSLQVVDARSQQFQHAQTAFCVSRNW